MNSIVRLRFAAIVIATLVCLAGCDAQKKIVAQINNEPIYDDDYNLRVQTITSIPETLNTDAGGMTMINIIRDQLTEQLARKYNAIPSDETVNAAAEYQVRMDPMTNSAITAGKMTREDLKHQKKFELEAFGIGTNGDKPSPADLDKAYEEYKTKPDLKIKESYTVKILQVPDAATGAKIITELKQTGDFKGVAQRVLALSAMDAVSAGREQTLVAEQLRPELRQALDKLKPNEFTPAPVAITVANPQQPMNTQTVYAVAQLKSKEPGHVLSKSEVGFLLTPIVLQKTHPEWKEHYRRELADFTKKSHIRIAIQRYEGLVDTFVRPLATQESGVHPGGMPTTPQPGGMQ